jgi:hypothetical protein
MHPGCHACTQALHDIRRRRHQMQELLTLVQPTIQLQKGNLGSANGDRQPSCTAQVPAIAITRAASAPVGSCDMFTNATVPAGPTRARVGVQDMAASAPGCQPAFTSACTVGSMGSEVHDIQEPVLQPELQLLQRDHMGMASLVNEVELSGRSTKASNTCSSVHGTQLGHQDMALLLSAGSTSFSLASDDCWMLWDLCQDA